MKKILLVFLFLTGCGDDQVNASTRFTDTTNKIQVDCASIYNDATTYVMMAYGQSNAANGVDVKYTPTNEVYNFFNGRCYIASDPLLGATNTNGSVWTRFADKFLDQNPQYNNVIIVAAAVGATSIYQWATDPGLINYLVVAKSQLVNKGMKLDAQYFHQGETDAFYGTLKHEYKYWFTNMYWYLRYYYVRAPIYVAQASQCFDTSSNQILEAQFELAEELAHVRHGPNTDLLGPQYRHDDCHFNDLGANEVAQGFVDYTLEVQ